VTSTVAAVAPQNSGRTVGGAMGLGAVRWTGIVPASVTGNSERSSDGFGMSVVLPLLRTVRDALSR
jgi:hypothetical protein